MRRHGSSRQPKNSCAGKLRYRTFAEAELEIDRARQFRGERLRSYACHSCGNVHLTSWTEDRQARHARGVT